VWVNNQVEPASVQPPKKLLEESGNNRFHKSGDVILTLKMVKSHFSFINSTLGSHLCQRDLNYHQNGSGPLDNETITTLSVVYLNL
jgi:hypothetical protein